MPFTMPYLYWYKVLAFRDSTFDQRSESVQLTYQYKFGRIRAGTDAYHYKVDAMGTGTISVPF